MYETTPFTLQWNNTLKIGRLSEKHSVFSLSTGMQQGRKTPSLNEKFRFNLGGNCGGWERLWLPHCRTSHKSYCCPLKVLHQAYGGRLDLSHLSQGCNKEDEHPGCMGSIAKVRWKLWRSSMGGG